MVIKNFNSLATSALRRQALLIAEAAYQAIDTKQAIIKNVSYYPEKQVLLVAGEKFALKKFQRIICIGFGKAALAAVAAVQEILKNKISCGFVIDLRDGILENITCKVGSHPYPTTVNIQATKELVAMLEGSSKTDLVICVVSGGGSSLLCYPHDLSCEAEVSIISALTVKGASILELNTVRKHISQVKGGHLAKICYPATLISLIFSDVPGNDIGMVASGPTVKDSTTNSDAAAILKKYDVLAMCQMPSCKLFETPKEDKYFQDVHNILLVSANLALTAMQIKAEELGFAPRIFSSSFQGQAKQLGPQVVGETKKHECLLGAGESTVKIIGQGLGGRNQEMALAALTYLKEDQVFLALASDGHDNTEAAGAIADISTKTKAMALGLKPEFYLENNDSFNFFNQIQDSVDTGQLSSNVSDFFISLKS